MARRTRRIGDVAKVAGVGVETIRFYEREGLIAQPPKPERGWREYDKRQLRQLAYVRLGREVGLTLGDIKRITAKTAGPVPAFCTEVRETVAARLADVEARIAALEEQRKRLDDWLGQCRVRPNVKGVGDCPLYQQLGALAPAKRKKER